MSNQIIIDPTDFSYMDQPQRSRCEELQAKMIELLPTQQWPDSDSLWLAAATALGNTDERYCRIYLCENCDRLYHGDYSINRDTNRDFCGSGCELEAKGMDGYEDEDDGLEDEFFDNDLDFGFYRDEDFMDLETEDEWPDYWLPGDLLGLVD